MMTVPELLHRKVLVVDDEPLIRQTLAYTLRDEYEVTAVASGEEALKVSSHETYPVVILDLCMEGLSGIETLKKLKEISATQNVIILTAYESMETAIDALNSGAFNYMTKPFERAHLKEVIANGFAAYDQQNLRKRDMQQRLLSVHDSFLSMLCHEFNTPLNSILGFSDLLMLDLEETRHAPLIEDIRQSGMHLHDILMEIVDYIGASYRAANNVDEKFTAAALLQPLVHQFSLKGVSLELHGRALHDRFMGPSKSIFMIARKLVGMAAQRSKHVSITLSNDPDKSLLRLTLSGTGLYVNSLCPEQMKALFEPYEPAALAGGQRPNLGLELATCRKAVEYAKGSIACHFNSKGELDFVTEIPVTNQTSLKDIGLG